MQKKIESKLVGWVPLCHFVNIGCTMWFDRSSTQRSLFYCEQLYSNRKINIKKNSIIWITSTGRTDPINLKWAQALCTPCAIFYSMTLVVQSVNERLEIFSECMLKMRVKHSVVSECFSFIVCALFSFFYLHLLLWYFFFFFASKTWCKTWNKEVTRIIRTGSDDQEWYFS